mgnify:CR=1 FL=1
MARNLTWILPLLWGIAGAAAGQVLNDPTRPPAGFVEAVPGEAVADTGPRLQSVMLPRQGRPAAVISGRTVRLGEMWGDSRLVAVSEGEVVLDGPQGRQRLLLTPDVTKEVVRDKKGRAPAGRKRETP